MIEDQKFELLSLNPLVSSLAWWSKARLRVCLWSGFPYTRRLSLGFVPYVFGQRGTVVGGFWVDGNGFLVYCIVV